MLRTLASGTYTLSELYDLAEASIDTARGNGHMPPSDDHPTDTVWKHRLRSALMNLKAKGAATRVDKATWLLSGTVQEPRRMALVLPDGVLADVELRVQDAVQLLGSLEEPADLVLVDPPYALNRGAGRFAGGAGYRRDHTKIVPGYREVDPSAYLDFTHSWIDAAAKVLRVGGQLAVVTGPQQSAYIQIAAEQAGLNWVSQIVAEKKFALKTTRRPSAAHWTITVMCRGALDHPARVFHQPPDLPRARNGEEYPLDWWPNNGVAHRPGRLRYDNALPLPLVRRLVTAFSDPGELVVDPMVGSGTTAIAAHELGRRFIGADNNPNAIRFTAARLLAEHLWPAARTPTLFAA